MRCRETENSRQEKGLRLDVEKFRYTSGFLVKERSRSNRIRSHSVNRSFLRGKSVETIPEPAGNSVGIAIFFISSEGMFAMLLILPVN